MAVIDNINTVPTTDEQLKHLVESLAISGNTPIIEATGYFARGYSKFVLMPTDSAGGIQDFLQGVKLLTTSSPPFVTGPGADLVGATDYVQLAGLIARIIEKVLLDKDFTAATKDLLLILQLFGVIK